MILNHQHNSSDHILALCCAIVLSLAMLLPSIAGYQHAERTGKVFLGTIRSDDFHRYCSFIEQTRVLHRVLYHDYSAVEPQTRRIVAIYFAILGGIARITGMTSVGCWIASGPVTAVFFFLVLTVWLRCFTPHLNPRVGLLLTAFSCGFEVVYDLFGIGYPRSRNWWMDGFSTFSLQHNPLKVSALAVAMCWLVILHHTTKRRQLLPAIAVSWIAIPLLWALHPNTAMVIYFAIPIYLVLLLVSERTRSVFRSYFPVVISMIIPVGLTVIYIFWMKSDPVVNNIVSCYKIPASESLLWYPLHYGWVLGLAIPALFLMRRHWSSVYAWNTAWLISGIGWSMNRTFTGLLFQHTLHIPLVILAAGILHQMRQKRWAIRTLAIVMSINFLVGDIHLIYKISDQTRGDVWPTSLYLEPAEAEALLYLGRQPKGNVFVNRNIGNKVGYLSLQNSFLGHWGPTPNRSIKEREWEKFFSPGTSAAWRQQFLARYRIRYLYFGREERRVGLLTPDVSGVLLFRRDGIEIREVSEVYPPLASAVQN